MNHTAFQELVAPPEWRSVDIISDLHLQPGDAATFEAWRGYLQTTPADALFILGDLFEVWVGDDAAAEPGFEAQCAQLLREASARHAVYFMHGNRDFLIGSAFAAQAGFTLLDDPTVLAFMNERWLLSHGDALCLEDTEYLRFREQVRSPAWQQAVLSQPLEQRRSLARSVRAKSEERQRDPTVIWADVDTGAARDWLAKAKSQTLIHGHTHRPARHDLGDGMQRIVLSDWDAAAHPPRAQLLCISAAGAQRVDLR
ncbi:UDP-2,3-diacylglucosamine diphosphatase [Variovorax sp. J22R133]|uniref:UDP-2,3-diacylglucosamine diphosphatase n=1 Tax=Variovorax brevis TaxID=3053503 RepID=UPI0025787C6D|nr:UDP-2,3-diacylglucosamine diphosphatase [Variovorax sp. J22R133]MDM0112669.1 UDP-2,3-diacylglucosamine diphosphatase [Variovorax sp. J22R133]